MDFLQSSYFLIGAIAVVVLFVILLILLRVRSRRASSSSSAHEVPAQAADSPSKSPTFDHAASRSPQPQVAAPTAMRDAGLATSASEEPDELTNWLSTPAPGEPDFSAPATVPGTPSHGAPAVAKGAAVPAAPSAAPRPFATAPPPTPTGDPVYAAVAAIATGTGPLNDADMRRLDLYRPDRLLSAVQSVRQEITETMHGGPAKRERLRAIAEYVEFSVEQATAMASIDKPASQPPIPDAASAEAEPPADTGEPEPHPEPVAASSALETPQAEPATEVSALTTAVTDEARDAAIPSATDTVELAEAPVVVPLQALTEAPTVSPVEVPPNTEVVVPLQTPAETTAEAEAEAKAEPEPPLSSPTEAPTPTERPVLDAVKTADDALPAAASRAETQTMTAADLKALPPEKWSDALQRIPLTELGEVLAASEDTAMKMKLVDHLERNGTSEALMLLDKCLQDPDPEIQVYALNAAERMLQNRG